MQAAVSTRTAPRGSTKPRENGRALTARLRKVWECAINISACRLPHGESPLSAPTEHTMVVGQLDACAQLVAVTRKGMWTRVLMYGIAMEVVGKHKTDNFTGNIWRKNGLAGWG
jgi:hypothetical protein